MRRQRVTTAPRTTVGDVVQEALTSTLRELFVVDAGEVVKYHGNARADVKRIMRQQLPDGEAELAWEEHPTIPNVVCMFPRAGAFGIKWRLTPGTRGLLLSPKTSIDVWRATGGSNDVPNDLREYHPGSAIFAPGFSHDDDPLDFDAEDGEIVIDFDWILLGAGATELIARADRVANWAGDFTTWSNTHTHTSAASGSPTSAPTAPPPNAPSATDLGCDKVKGV